MQNTRPLVAVVMGSTSDAEIMKVSMEQLDELSIPYEVNITSAHRTPQQTKDFAEEAMDRGIEVIIAGAGWSAHLAGVIAAHTRLPVIGVPIDSSVLNGMDALLSTVQMPPGIPVATVAIGTGGARNASILAAQILALKYPDIANNLKSYRENLTRKAIEKAKNWKG